MDLSAGAHRGRGPRRGMSGLEMYELTGQGLPPSFVRCLIFVVIFLFLHGDFWRSMIFYWILLFLFCLRWRSISEQMAEYERQRQMLEDDEEDRSNRLSTDIDLEQAERGLMARLEQAGVDMPNSLYTANVSSRILTPDALSSLMQLMAAARAAQNTRNTNPSEWNPGAEDRIAALPSFPYQRADYAHTKAKPEEVDLEEGSGDGNGGMEDDGECPICIDHFEEGDQLKKLPCGHLFHSDCVDRWLRLNANCPCCKRDVFGQSDT